MMKPMKALKALFAALSAAGLLLIGTGTAMQLMLSADGYTGNISFAQCEFDKPRELVAITSSMPINVKYGDTEKVKVEYYSSLPLIITEENGMLRITQNDTFTLTLFSLKAYEMRLDITLPHKTYEHIRLSSSSGDISAAGLNTDSLEINTKSGNISLTGIDERTGIRTESGEIEAYFSSLSSDMTINAGTGDVTLIFPRDIRFNLEFYTDGGSFTSDLFEKNYYREYGDAAVLSGEAHALLTVNTTKGDLTIK